MVVQYYRNAHHRPRTAHLDPGLRKGVPTITLTFAPLRSPPDFLGTWRIYGAGKCDGTACQRCSLSPLSRHLPACAAIRRSRCGSRTRARRFSR